MSPSVLGEVASLAAFFVARSEALKHTVIYLLFVCRCPVSCLSVLPLATVLLLSFCCHVFVIWSCHGFVVFLSFVFCTTLVPASLWLIEQLDCR